MSKKRIDSVKSEQGMPVKVRVFDIGEAVNKGSNGQYKIVGETKYAVLEGSCGFILVDTDAVHRVIKDRQEKLLFGVAKVQNNEIPMIPDAMLPTCVDTIMELPSIEMELGQFVRRFGGRIENNYQTLLTSISEIGLNPVDYPRGEEERFNRNKYRINAVN